MTMVSHPTVEVTLCPDGPLLVRGATTVVDDQGSRHSVTRPVVALCRCGSSGSLPWCDGMHKLLQQRDAKRDQDHHNWEEDRDTSREVEP